MFHFQFQATATGALSDSKELWSVRRYFVPVLSNYSTISLDCLSQPARDQIAMCPLSPWRDRLQLRQARIIVGATTSRVVLYGTTRLRDQRRERPRTHETLRISLRWHFPILHDPSLNHIQFTPFALRTHFLSSRKPSFSFSYSSLDCTKSVSDTVTLVNPPR